MGHSLLRLCGILVFCLVSIMATGTVMAEEDKFDAELAAELGADEYGMRSYVFCMQIGRASCRERV